MLVIDGSSEGFFLGIPSSAQIIKAENKIKKTFFKPLKSLLGECKMNFKSHFFIFNWHTQLK